MLCEQVLGNLDSGEFQTAEIDYVEIEWHETYKRQHKKITAKGQEIGIRLGNYILAAGLKEGDVLYRDHTSVIAVTIPPCECIVIRIDEQHPQMLGKVCYEIGNKHAALFWGSDGTELITPYNEPTLKLLKQLHGVTAQVEMVKLDFDKSIASVVHSHTH